MLPGALTPAELWALVAAGRDAVTSCPDGRWGVAREDVLAPFSSEARERAWTDRGGFVSGFDEVFDPRGFAQKPEDLLALDPLVRWLLHAARECLRDARGADVAGRTDVVVGNLMLPSAGLAAFVARTWIERQQDWPAEFRRKASGVLPATSPQNRDLAGAPAAWSSQALGLGGAAFCLDAACASSLYAIKYGCDRLQDGEADLVLAGAANGADFLFLHVGFSALQALSPSGRSRPFHRDADGLIPAEGAASWPSSASATRRRTATGSMA